MIDTMDKLIAALGESTKCRFYKASIASQTAGIMVSMWKATGYPTVGATPTTEAVCDSSTVGSWVLPTVTTEKLYLGKLSACCSSAGQLIVFDRLAHMGGLNGTLTTAQTANVSIATPATQGRCGSDGTGVLWCLEWYTATGATAVTATITYTNQAGTTGRTTTVALAATRPVGCLLPILPNASDLRIQSIQSVTLSATTGTAGNFGITALARQSEASLCSANIGVVLDYASLALEQLTPNSCLMLGWIPTTTSTGNIMGSFEVLKG